MIETVNAEIAARLEEVARILNEQGANRFRVDAYRRAAMTIGQLTRPVSEIVRAEGIEGLRQLPGIGETLARAIYQTVVSGRMPMLERLRGEADPVALLASVPGIGKVLGERLHEELGIDTLEDLEAAAHDGRLADIAGLGEKRIAGIQTR
jgi:DNA polymerase (family 10)